MTNQPHSDHEELLQALFDTATEAMLIAEPDGTIVRANAAGCQQTGFRVNGRFSLQALFPQTVPTLNFQFQNYQMRQLDGRLTTVTIETRPLNNGRFLLILHHPSEQTEARQKIVQLTETVQTINDLAIKLNGLLVAPKPIQQIATIIQEIPGVFGVSVSTYQPQTRELLVEQVALPPTESGVLSRINSLIGRSLVGMRIPVSEAMHQRMFNELVTAVGTLHDVTFGEVPKAVSAAFHRAFRIDRLYGLALIEGEELLGTAVIAMRRNAEPLTHELRVMLSRVCAIALRRTRYEHELKTSEAKFRSYIEHAPVGIFVVNVNGRYIETNQAASQMLGYTEAELLNLSIAELVHEDFLGTAFTHFQAVFATGHASGEYCLRTKAGAALWTNVEAARLSDTDLIAFVQDITESKKAQQALIEQVSLQNQLTQIAATVPGMIYSLKLEPNGKISMPYVSPAVGETYGLSCQALATDASALFANIHPDDNELISQTIKESAETMKPWHAQFRYYHPQKGECWIEGQSMPQREADGSILWHGFVQDVTERKAAENEQLQLEANLRQMQKMDSIGRLAGGVAHDFNNLLTVIQMYADLMESQMSPEDPLLPKLAQIQRASERASELTRHLLAFSRKQILNTAVINLNQLITQLQKMLGRLIGEDIELSVCLEPDLWNILADPGQIEQVIMNLVVNARDAMPTGGQLTIETHNIQLDETFLTSQLNTPSGPCVILAISDTGQGMDETTRQRIFEPFFTTKGPGSGTGLGLAMVHGIVQQSGGSIFVYSKPNQGSTFKIYLPASTTTPVTTTILSPEISDTSGSDTILVVEDETAVRDLVRTTLIEQGYTIMTAQDGEEAIKFMAQQSEPVDLLLTDVVMPKMSGRELAEQLQEKWPSLKVLFMSGYMEDAVVRHGILTAQVAFLSKPFSRTMLVNKVRETLDGR